MFEKFSNLNVDSSGSGGEYTVQMGFGWTNGVLLWVAANYGEMLAAPVCPALVATNVGTGSSSGALAGPRTVTMMAMVLAMVVPLVAWAVV